VRLAVKDSGYFGISVGSPHRNFLTPTIQLRAFSTAFHRRRRRTNNNNEKRQTKTEELIGQPVL